MNLKIRFKNIGKVEWLPTTALYQIGQHEFTVFKNCAKKIEVGHCKGGAFKPPLEFLLCAPN